MINMEQENVMTKFYVFKHKDGSNQVSSLMGYDVEARCEDDAMLMLEQGLGYTANQGWYAECTAIPLVANPLVRKYWADLLDNS
jgi:hypothetical protein